MRSALLACTVGLVLSFGTVTGQIQTASAQIVGSVIDADSKAPIAGARITVFPATRPTMPMPITPLTAVTDESGRFVLEGVQPGPVRVSAQKQGFAFDPRDAQTLDVRAGQTRVTGLEIRLISAPSFRVAGIVVDASGKPVPDAMVTLQSRDPNGRGAFFPPLFTRANADGTFVIGGVLSGTYEVAATRMIRSGTVVSSTFMAMGSSRWHSGTLQQIVVDSPDVTALKLVAPTPPQ